MTGLVSAASIVTLPTPTASSGRRKRPSRRSAGSILSVIMLASPQAAADLAASGSDSIISQQGLPALRVRVAGQLPSTPALPVGGAFRTDQIEAIFAALENNFGLHAEWIDPQHVRFTSGREKSPSRD